MVTPEVLEVITFQNDLTAKLFLLIVIGVYMLLSFWMYNRVNFDTITNKIYKISLFIYSRVTLFFYPFMAVTFLHLNTTLEEMIIIVSAFYGIIMVGTFTFLIMKGFEKTLDLLGIDKGGLYK